MAPLHFLVVDDDLDKRLLLGRTISRAFPTASVFECHSGQEALEYFRRNRVDVLVTDHSMYPVNGVELIREVRAAGATLPIIMVTNHDHVHDEAYAAGANLVVSGADIRTLGDLILHFLEERANRTTTAPSQESSA